MIATNAGTSSVETIRISVDDIEVADGQPREHFDETKLKQLAQSMGEFDLLQPIGVRAGKGSGDWELCFGERRLRAAKLLGWSTIEVRVLDLSDVDALKVMGIENINRDDWSVLEKATYLDALGKTGMTNKQMSQIFGNKESWSTNLRRLLKLPEHIKQRLISGEIFETQARYLLRFVDRPHVLAAIEEDLDSSPELWRTRSEFEERAEQIAACFDKLETPAVESRNIDSSRTAAAGDRQQATESAPRDWTKFKPYLPIIEPLRKDRDALLLLRELVDVLLEELKQPTASDEGLLERSA